MVSIRLPGTTSKKADNKSRKTSVVSSSPGKAQEDKSSDGPKMSGKAKARTSHQRDIKPDKPQDQSTCKPWLIATRKLQVNLLIMCYLILIIILAF